MIEATLSALAAGPWTDVGTIQSLWSGYGRLARWSHPEIGSVVVKHVRPPERPEHPRGWAGDLGHRRKLESYRIEPTFYREWSHACGDGCRVPRFLGSETSGTESVLVLEDLDAAGFPGRRRAPIGRRERDACIRWLADFHATFLGRAPDGLWASGTYWHLRTRPDELEALDDPTLRDAAPAIDAELASSPWQTLVHGDAKLANFCFSPDGGRVAAVDFQYVGGGCGMKDLAYFVGSCLADEDCARQEGEILDVYFERLRSALQDSPGSRLADDRAPDAAWAELEADWRRLYPFAWADFHRFLKGWSPGHWKDGETAERMVRRVLRELEATA